MREGCERKKKKKKVMELWVACESVSVIEKNYANNVAIMDTTRTVGERGYTGKF